MSELENNLLLISYIFLIGIVLGNALNRKYGAMKNFTGVILVFLIVLPFLILTYIFIEVPLPRGTLKYFANFIVYAVSCCLAVGVAAILDKLIKKK